MVAGYTMGMEPSGRELLVAVVKGTFHLPGESGSATRLHEQQMPLVMADTFTGEPGFSAPYHEVDFAPRKRRCDVLLQGSAYAPQGRPSQRVPVGIRIGDWSKSFAVVGDRHWQASFGSISSSEPAPFIAKRISYDCAYGGVETRDQNTAGQEAYMRNPVGKGFHRQLKSDFADGCPLPNTEELNRAVDRPDGEFAPMAFGPVGRGWMPRIRHAGTYDQNWLDNVFPFLPADFDDGYYQAAPDDQQINYPQGGEEVVLVNLSPAGRLSFNLPLVQVPIVFFGVKGPHHETMAALDTIAIFPDDGVFTLTWRASLPLKKNMFEVRQLLAGRMPRAWWRARELGKTWYPSLAHLPRSCSNCES
jgi:hypothetical protein